MMTEHLFVEVKFTHALITVLEISLLICIYTIGLYFFLNYMGDSISLQKFDLIEGGFGAIIGLLLVFRTNKAYERWWEARSLWGNLVNISRNLAIKIQVHIQPTQQEAKEFATLISNFCDALAIHLRKSPDDIELHQYIRDKTIKHVPAYIATKLYEKIQHKIADKQSFNSWVMDRELRDLMVVCGGCEKIKNTLLSVSYRMFVKHVMILFILMMPLSILDNVGLYSIPIVIVTSYIILALEAIARNLEEPFGITEDHIQLCAINSNIKLSVHEILGVQYQNSN
jgi:putative membrane protein